MWWCIVQCVANVWLLCGAYCGAVITVFVLFGYIARLTGYIAKAYYTNNKINKQIIVF